LTEQLATHYFVIKKYFEAHKEIPPHEPNWIIEYKKCNIEITLEEMIEFRDFMENTYIDWATDRALDQKYEIIDLKKMNLE
jgi:hypothetical protein